MQSAFRKPPPVPCRIGAAHLSRGDPTASSATGLELSSTHPPCLLINHSGCDCCCHCCRHHKTEDVVSSLLHKAFLLSPGAFKVKHPFFFFFLFFLVLWQRNVSSDLKSRKKSCSSVLMVAAAGSLLPWCSGRVRALKCRRGSNLQQLQWPFAWESWTKNSVPVYHSDMSGPHKSTSC